MRNRIFVFLFAVVLIIFLGAIVNASTCINLKLAKTSYLPYETVQVEIDADVSQDIRESDVFLTRQETTLPTKFFLSKVSAGKYFVWFDLPLSSGDYTVKVRGSCRDGSFYVASVPLKVKATVAAAYSELKNSVKDKFSALNFEEHLFTSIAFIDDDISEQALASYLERADSCLIKNCSTKFNALTLMAFKDSLLRQKMLDAVEAAQNNVNKGSWKLQLVSDVGQECMLLINNESSILILNSGANVFDLNFNVSGGGWVGETILVKVNCNNPSAVNGKVIYTYKQFSKEIVLTGLQTLLNNKKCFAMSFEKTFSEDCDNEATSYSLIALARTDKFNVTIHNEAVSWLSGNAKTIIDKAVAFYINHDATALSELLSSQTASGWWPKALGEYQANVEASSIALLALKSSAAKINETPVSNVIDAIEKGEKWLLDKSKTASLKERATILAFAFSAKEAEPLLGFWPGLVKTASSESFNLILQNKGTEEIVVNAALLNSSVVAELKLNELKNLKFNIPLTTTIDGRTLVETLVLNYNTKISDRVFSYNIPVLIFTQKASQEQTNGTVNASQQEINQSEQHKIIKETQQQTENKTSEINQSLLQLFRFIERNVSKNVDANEPFTVTVRLINKLDREISDVTITYSSSLILMGGSIRIEPSFIKTMAKEEMKTITIYFSPSNSGNHSGSIIVTAKYNNQDITTSLPVGINVASAVAEEKNCSELGGKICEKEDEFCETNLTTTKDSYYCCIPSESCKKKPAPGQTTALIIVIVIVVILLIVLLLLSKKPKKEMKEFLKETSKQYERRFQRPPGISRV